MFIQVEETPNPNTLKFLPNQAVTGSVDTYDFATIDDVGDVSPLATRLFALSGVERIFLGRDFVSITATNVDDWDQLKSTVMNALLDHYTSGMPAIQKQSAESATEQSDDPVVMQIIELIETRVRPAVAADGGDIRFERFEDGVVYLHLQGACAGCPSSSLTLKSGIENMLKHYVPEVQDVQAV